MFYYYVTFTILYKCIFINLLLLLSLIVFVIVIVADFNSKSSERFVLGYYNLLKIA